MILPNSKAYSALQIRLKDVASLLKILPPRDEEEDTKMSLLRYEELQSCFISINLPPHRKYRTSLKSHERVSIYSSLLDEPKSGSVV